MMAFGQFYAEPLVGVVPAEVALYPCHSILHSFLTNCFRKIVDRSRKRTEKEVAEVKRERERVRQTCTYTIKNWNTSKKVWSFLLC